MKRVISKCLVVLGMGMIWGIKVVYAGDGVIAIGSASLPYGF
jgi:hypothetical protein